MKMSEGGIIDGVIEASEEEINLKIVVQSTERGECMAYFYIEIEDGAPVSFQVVANFMGSIVRCYQPIVDYGLVKVNTTEDFEIEIENESPIEAELLIKNAANSILNMSNMIESRGIGDGKVIDEECLIFDKPLLTKKCNLLMMDQYVLRLKPLEKVTVLVSL